MLPATMKQFVITNCKKIRDTIVAMFKSQDNSMMTGTVKRVTRDNIIVDIGNDVEAILPRDQLLPGEIYKINDRDRKSVV